jgi:hypothetical protein
LGGNVLDGAVVRALDDRLGGDPPSANYPGLRVYEIDALALDRDGLSRRLHDQVGRGVQAHQVRSEPT